MTAIHRFNSLSRAEADARLKDCCGSSRWVSRMADCRPIENEAEFHSLADEMFDQLDDVDWFEAFACHPKIGATTGTAAQSPSASQWSRREQSAIIDSAQSIREELAAANREYALRFGFIFIVCATGKSPDQMLAILRARIENDREPEIRIAAEEQRRITHLRIGTLLDELAA